MPPLRLSLTSTATAILEKPSSTPTSISSSARKQYITRACQLRLSQLSSPKGTYIAYLSLFIEAKVKTNGLPCRIVNANMQAAYCKEHVMENGLRFRLAQYFGEECDIRIDVEAHFSDIIQLHFHLHAVLGQRVPRNWICRSIRQHSLWSLHRHMQGKLDVISYYGESMMSRPVLKSRPVSIEQKQGRKRSIRQRSKVHSILAANSSKCRSATNLSDIAGG